MQAYFLLKIILFLKVTTKYDLLFSIGNIVFVDLNKGIQLGKC